jgi:uncharacterized protein (DUF169 family)
MLKNAWQDYAVSFKELLALDYEPVALSCSKEPFLKDYDKKARICKSILDAGRGEVLQVSKANNACFGAMWHLGFYKRKGQRFSDLIRKFAVEEEKLFCSYEALDALISQMGEPPDNVDSYFLLSPLGKAQVLPQLVIFIVNAEAACRLLALAQFQDGVMPAVKIGGPTCRLAVIYPLVSGQINLSFYDFTSRTICAVDRDKLLVTIPYARIPGIIASIEKCPAGKINNK